MNRNGSEAQPSVGKRTDFISDRDLAKKLGVATPTTDPKLTDSELFAILDSIEPDNLNRLGIVGSERDLVIDSAMRVFDKYELIEY